MGIRDEEIKTLKKAKYVGAGMSFTWYAAPFMVR